MLEAALRCVLREVGVTALPDAVVSRIALYSHDQADAAMTRFEEWCARAGLHTSRWGLCAAEFEFGRGLLYTGDAAAPDTETPPVSVGGGALASAPIVLSIPEALLITPDKVRRAKSLSAVWSSASKLGVHLTTSQALSLFLVVEQRLGAQSKWAPYVAVLPSEYSTLCWWSDALLDAAFGDADHALLAAVRKERREIAAERDAVNRVLLAADAPFAPLSAAEYRWAYSTVATRACYYLRAPPTAAASAAPTTSSPPVAGAADGDSALVPFLDLLNHSGEVSCHTALHHAARQYQLRSSMMLGPTASTTPSAAPATPTGPVGRELFISYGEHGNAVLLQRYGFALPANAHDRVLFRRTELDAFLADSMAAFGVPTTAGAAGGAVGGAASKAARIAALKARADSKAADRRAGVPIRAAALVAPTGKPTASATAAGATCSGVSCVAHAAAATTLSAEQKAIGAACGVFASPATAEPPAPCRRAGASDELELAYGHVPWNVWVWFQIRLLCPHDIAAAGGASAVATQLLADQCVSAAKQQLYTATLRRFAERLRDTRHLDTPFDAQQPPPSSSSSSSLAEGEELPVVSAAYVQHCVSVYRGCQRRILNTFIV